MNLEISDDSKAADVCSLDNTKDQKLFVPAPSVFVIDCATCEYHTCLLNKDFTVKISKLRTLDFSGFSCSILRIYSSLSLTPQVKFNSISLLWWYLLFVSTIPLLRNSWVPYISWYISLFGGFRYSRVPYLSSKQGGYNDVTLLRSANWKPSITSLTFLNLVLKSIVFCHRFSDLAYTLRFGSVKNPIPSRVNYCRCFGCPLLSLKVTGSWVKKSTQESTKCRWRMKVSNPQPTRAKSTPIWYYVPRVIWEYTERRQKNLA